MVYDPGEMGWPCWLTCFQSSIPTVIVWPGWMVMTVMTWAQGAKGRRHVSIDYVAGGVGDLELEAAAGVCEGEGCGLGSLVRRAKLDVYSVTQDVGVLVCYDSIDDVRV